MNPPNKHLNDEDYLHSRGWDFMGSMQRKSGTAKIYRSRRTGEMLPKNKAVAIQRARDQADKNKR